MASNLDLSGLESVMTGEDADHARQYQLLSVTAIQPDPEQPRTQFDQTSIDELAASIETRGLLQPISVRPDPDDEQKYIINYGERRWRAVSQLGQDRIKTIIDADFSNEDQLLENIQREDLDAGAVAAGIERLIEGGMTATDVGKSLGKSKEWVSRYRSFGRASEDAQALYYEGVAPDVRSIADIERARSKHGETVTHLIAALADAGTPINRSELMRRIAACTDSDESVQADGEAAAPAGDSAGESNPVPRDGDTASESGDDGESSESPVPATPAQGDVEDVALDEGPASDSQSVGADGACTIAVAWSDDGIQCNGQLVLEAQDDHRQVVVYGDDGEYHEMPAAAVQILAITPD